MKHSRRLLSTVATMLTIALGGGTLFGGCATRFKEAAVDGAKDYLLTDFLGLLLDVDMSTSANAGSYNWLD